MVEPLTWEWKDECVSKVILVTIFGGGAPALAIGGRTILRRSREFDSTMGYGIPERTCLHNFSPSQILSLAVPISLNFLSLFLLLICFFFLLVLIFLFYSYLFLFLPHSLSFPSVGGF